MTVSRIRRVDRHHQHHRHFLLPWKLAWYVQLLLVVIIVIWVIGASYFFQGIVDKNSSNNINNNSNLFNDNVVSTGNSQPCKYNGNCPTHTVCEDGMCLPYFDENKKNDRNLGHDKCVRACWKELETDEHWYFEASARILETYGAQNGHGCVIDYERDLMPSNKNKNSMNKDFGTVEEWMENRYRYVVRVDPVDTPRGKRTSTWRALCDLPCKHSSKAITGGAATSTCPAGTMCLGQPEHNVPTPEIRAGPFTCQKKSRVQSLSSQMKDVVIVSGADEGYFEAMRNMAASLQYWAPKKKLVVYNLGLLPEQVEDARSWSNVIEVKWPDGIPDSLPPHVHEGKKYAWKPIAINETVHQYKSIFWSDAGSVFTGPLWPIDEILHRDGIFLVHGQDDDMKPQSHPETYKWFGYDKDTFRDGVPSPHCGGSAQGYVFPSRYIDTVVKPWAECAMDENCIAPPRSGLGNHRYDQTVTSILAYQEHVQAPHHTEYLAAFYSQLNPDLHKPSHRIIFWTARGASFEYRSFLRKKDE